MCRVDLNGQLAELLRPAARARGLWPSGAVNIGTPDNYRVADRAYFVQLDAEEFESTAEVVVEIVSPGGELHATLAFYFERGVTELLIVDPERAAVEWYLRGEAAFVRAAGSVLLDMTEADLAARLNFVT